MFKKILFLVLLIFIALTAWKQDSNAKTWERRDTTVHADSILAAIERGDSIRIGSCNIFGPLIKEVTRGKLATINSFIDISFSTFLDTVSFVDCYFMKSVYFGYDTFREEVTFYHTTFGGEAGFFGATFAGDADFRWTTFSGNAFFSRSTFGGDAWFWSSTFDTTVSFWFARFYGQVDLSVMRFKGIDISWKQLEGHLVCDTRTSYKLMKCFEDQRQLDDADGVYLFLKDQERIEKPWYIRYPEYWFIQLTCGYGVKPLNTLYLSIIIISVFSLFYTKSNAIKEIEKEFGHRRMRRKYRIVHKGFRKRLYDALYFSVQTFVIGVVPDWHPTDEFLIKFWKIKRIKFRTLSMIEGALGWILLVLFVVTLTRKFIR